MLKEITVAVALCASFGAMAKAPFGFNWGEDITAYGASDIVHTYFYQVNKVKARKKHSLAELYTVVGTKEAGVQKVLMISKDITNDIYGSEGKENFNLLVGQLKKAGYKEEMSFSEVGLELYKDSDEFYQCLKYSGCGYYSWLGKDANGDIASVELKGLSRGLGYIKAAFESSKFSSLVDMAESAENVTDQAAF